MNIDLNIGGILRRSAQRFASRTAIEDLHGNTLSYPDLHATSNDLSLLLQQQGIGFGHRIGILAPKSISYPSCIFAILQSEAAYVPLDPQAPAERNVMISHDCQLQALFIEPSALEKLTACSDFTEKYRKIDISSSLSLLVFEDKKLLHNLPLAYLLYTSGSTGTPKGVMHTHASASAFINWGAYKFRVLDTDRIASHAPFHFDLSIFDIFVSVTAGSTLVLLDEKTAYNPLSLASQLSLKQISIFYATPSTLSYMSLYGKMHKHSYPSLRTLLFAGEVFPLNNLRKLKEFLPHTTMFNLYGPTETNVCTHYQVPQTIPDDRTESFPIGKPCDYAMFKIAGIEESNDKSGELWISGDSLMAGYWNDETKTNASFETGDSGRVWYKTGDIVRLDGDRQLVYIRRNDRMIKRNGYRIELNEIEKQLYTQLYVAEAAVTCSSSNSQTNSEICAHVVTKNGKQLSGEDVLAHCRKTLPAYMLPDKILFYTTALPKTSTHKIDYRQLASYD